MNCAALWPDPKSDGAMWGHWVVVAERLGAVFPLTRGFMLGIRGASLYAEETHPLRAEIGYRDSFVLLSRDLRTPPCLFEGSTVAYQLNSKLSPDVNHDGVGDVATIKPGRFVLKLIAGKYPVFALTMPNGSHLIPSFRDLRHDGTPDDGPFEADQILFHVGHPAPADSTHKSSIGCQTAPLEWLRVMATEARLGDGALDYVMADAPDVLRAVPSGPENLA